jgi:hypothetical protein
MINPSLFDLDLDLETRIAHAALLTASAKLTPDERRAAWEVLKALVAQRTPERVSEMEVERGLAR